MSIESDLVAHLKADVTIKALLTYTKDSIDHVKIYPLIKPQDVGTPYITYQVINDNSNQCIEGIVYQNDARFQLDCWSTKYSEVKAIKEAVISALIGFKSSNSISNMDDYEPDTKLYRQLIDFKLKGK